MTPTKPEPFNLGQFANELLAGAVRQPDTRPAECASAFGPLGKLWIHGRVIAPQPGRRIEVLLPDGSTAVRTADGGEVRKWRPV